MTHRSLRKQPMPSIDTLKIGPFVFAVELGSPEDDKGNEVDGKLWHSQARIVIDKDLEKQPQKQTLLHEIVHEIAIQSGQDVSEGLVDAIAFGIYQVVRDNPKLVRMIQK
jgi:hypothetical protein